MQAKFAVSRVRDPMNGRFVSVKVIRSQVVETKGGAQAVAYVDLIIQLEGGPYYRVRMDLEAAAEIARDMAATERRARGDVTVQESEHLFPELKP